MKTLTVVSPTHDLVLNELDDFLMHAWWYRNIFVSTGFMLDGRHDDWVKIIISEPSLLCVVPGECSLVLDQNFKGKVDLLIPEEPTFHEAKCITLFFGESLTEGGNRRRMLREGGKRCKGILGEVALGLCILWHCSCDGSDLPIDWLVF